MFQAGEIYDYLFTLLDIFLLFYCIEYQVTNPVTNESQGTTAHLTDIPDTTIVTTITDSKETKDSNGISTDDTTIDLVTNEGNGTTPHHTDILKTTDTMPTNSEKITQLNEITTVSTTFDKNDDRNVSFPFENNYDTDTDRFTTDGKSRP